MVYLSKITLFFFLSASLMYSPSYGLVDASQMATLHIALLACCKKICGIFCCV